MTALLAYKILTEIKQGADGSRLITSVETSAVDYPDKVTSMWISLQEAGLKDRINSGHETTQYSIPGTTFKVLAITVLSVTKIED
jgi:hypothetical protein